ncbi:MAG: DUF3137 domain-containing protein [Alphaproteobacteria bacterium]|nr:DUF3137 domain-containing protein [Alphaproteobacteria bacterium]
MSLETIRNKTDKQLLDECSDKLQKLETIRHIKLHSYNFRKKISIPAATILTPLCGWIDYWLFMLQRGSDDSAAGVTFLVLSLLWYWTTQPKRQYAKEYKKKILPDIANIFGNFTYKHNPKPDLHHLKKSLIVPNHTRCKAEDFFSGQYKDITIEFLELKLIRGSGKNKKIVFKGLMIFLDLKHKKFYGHTILMKEMIKIAHSGKLKIEGQPLKRANLVDPKFEKVFDVYTSDQVEARYLLDPVMMEDLVALRDEYEGNGLSAAMYDSKMLIMINSNHNYFEPADIHIPATAPDSIISMKHEIEKTLSIVDKLSLYDPVTMKAEQKLQEA